MEYIVANYSFLLYVGEVLTLTLLPQTHSYQILLASRGHSIGYVRFGVCFFYINVGFVIGHGVAFDAVQIKRHVLTKTAAFMRWARSVAFQTHDKNTAFVRVLVDYDVRDTDSKEF